MPTYVYETISREENEIVRFELKQSMREPALAGEPVRRVISGGYGYVKGIGTAAPMAAAGGDCCPGC